MSTIDPSRLLAIFRSLSASESQKNAVEDQKKLGQARHEAVKSVDIKSNLQRNKEDLKRNIYLRLQKLKQQDPQFREKAPSVVIKEILLWEFGDNLLQHPEFNHFLQTIVSQVGGHHELDGYLAGLIEKMATP